MRILVLGASGGCGQWAVRLAIDGGHAVTAALRHGSPHAPPAAATRRAVDVLDAAALGEVVAGHDAVLSCLGPQRVTPRNPWSPLRSPDRFAERSAAALVAAARAAGGVRIRAISAAGVGDSAAGLNLPMRFLLHTSTVGLMYRDLERMEAVYAASGLDWAAVRPVTLRDGPPSGRLRVVPHFAMTMAVRRDDVAAWLLDAALRPAPADRTPQIAS